MDQDVERTKSHLMRLWQRAIEGDEQAVEGLMDSARTGNYTAVELLLRCALKHRNATVGKWICDRALDGNAHAVKALIGGLYGLIASRYQNVAEKRTLDSDHCDDFVQDVMTALLVGPKAALLSFQPDRGQLPSFVRGVADHKALDRRNKEMTRQKVLEVEIESDGNNSPVDRLNNQLVLKQALKRVQAMLSPEELIIFSMWFLEGKSAKFIAQHTKLSVQVIYNRTSDMRKLARRIYRELIAGSD